MSLSNILCIIVIIQLIGSVIFWSKVIPLSGVNCTQKIGRRSLLQKSEHQKPTKMKENIKKFVNNHYIESVFLVHHYYDKNQTFDVLILLMASKKIRTLKNLWRITYGYQGLWGVRLGSVRLGQVWLGWVRLGQARLGSITLSQIRLGQVRLESF